MTRPQGRSAAGTLTIVLTLVFWTSVPLFLRYFADYVDAWTSNGWRYGFAALVWLPLVVVSQLRGSLPRGIWRAALVPSLVNSVSQVTFTCAHYRIDPALLTFGLRSHMVFAAIGAYLMFPGERPVIRSPRYIVGLLALMVGTSGAVLLGDDPVTGAHVQGVVLAVASGLLFASYAIAVRRYMTNYGSVISFAVISQYTAAAMVTLMLVLGGRGGLEVLDMSGRDIFLLLLSALIGIASGTCSTTCRSRGWGSRCRRACSSSTRSRWAWRRTFCSTRS